MNESQANSSFLQNTTAKSPFSSFFLPPMALKVSMLTLQVAIAFVGVFGNVLVIAVITKRANMKSSMNFYLRNLAITDLGILLINFPMTAISVHGTSGWLFGRFLCLYVYPAMEIFYGASIWSITVIAIERYKNIISRKVFVKKVESFKRVTLKIVLIWFISFSVVAVPTYPFMVYIPDGTCQPNWPKFHDNLMLKAYGVCLAIFWYLLPLAIITVTYWKISSKLQQSNTFHKTMHGDDTSKSQLLKQEEKQRLKQNKKAQRILTPLIIIFAVTMLPVNVLRLMVGFSLELLQKYVFLLLDVCALFIVINSAADPIVYYIASKEFRVGIKAILCSKGKSNKGTHCTRTYKLTRTLSSSRNPTQTLEIDM